MRKIALIVLIIATGVLTGCDRRIGDAQKSIDKSPEELAKKWPEYLKWYSGVRERIFVISMDILSAVEKAGKKGKLDDTFILDYKKKNDTKFTELEKLMLLSSRLDDKALKLERWLPQNERKNFREVMQSIRMRDEKKMAEQFKKMKITPEMLGGIGL